MDEKKKEYMRLWRLRHPENVSNANRMFRLSHPDYHRSWMASHPNYQQRYRERNPNYRKLWYIRYKSRNPELQARRKQLLTQLLSSRSPETSFLKPNPEEYGEFPSIAREVINLKGCKYLINQCFCNQQKLINKPYCSIHSMICYQPGNHTVSYDELT